MVTLADPSPRVTVVVEKTAAVVRTLHSTQHGMEGQTPAVHVVHPTRCGWTDASHSRLVHPKRCGWTTRNEWTDDTRHPTQKSGRTTIVHPTRYGSIARKPRHQWGEKERT